jgi:hypothetical protein
VAVVFLLLLAAVALINYSPVQSYLAKKAAGILSEKLETKVEVANLRIGLLNKLFIQGVYLEDQSKDTLLYAGEIQVRITDWFIFKDKPVIHFVGLKDAYVHLYRGANAKTWNYDFIADAFSSPKKKDTTTSQPVEFDLKKIELERVRIHMDDSWIGEDMHYDVGYVLIDADGLDFGKKQINVDEIAIKEGGVYVNEYDGGRPAHLRPKRPDTMDTTPFNPDMWTVNIKSLSLNDCSFKYKSNDKTPTPGEFDENHMDIRGISSEVSSIYIVGDTIHGNIDNLTAKDRCGIMIKKLKTKVSVSPIASICEDLYLETNNSQLHDYYAMHYRHFPAFNDYIDSVTMVARLKDAHVDKRDIAFFAPQLTDFPEMILTVSGNGKGTVSDLSGTKMNISDGNFALKGNITMKGLPDIYTTYITFTDGEILTTGKGITHYAPSMKGNPNLAVDSITYAFFKGDYEGYIENFRVNGILKSNLGTIATDMKMSLPDFNSDSATYTGLVTTDKLQLGKLIRQPLFGTITLNEKVSGKSFSPDLLQLKIDGYIFEFGVYGYPYHNINTHGILTRKQFDGNLLVDDPNLALEFDGSVNYSEKLMKIKAEAHLLGANFNKLQFTPENITATGDFDLNWTGSNIDDFSGYAKLFNIDLKRNNHKLAIDSVYVLSAGTAANRRLDIKSDAFTAGINGNFRLSDLPASVQFYLSRYIPNYIKAPEKFAPDQDLTFRITTTAIDSIFAVAFPVLRGFDHATISGSLNTSSRKLTLDGNIPYARIGNIHLKNLTLTGVGDQDILALSTNAENASVGDSLLTGSLSLTTSVGNDSITFTLATVSPDLESSFGLNGRIVANHDTLQLNLFPSQFFMKKVKWEIAGGSNIVYSKNYLLVNGINLSSGLQHITCSTKNVGSDDQSLVLTTENLDLAQLSNWAGFSYLQPDGRINADVRVENIFSAPLVSANLRATNVKLGADTIGAINIVGYYDDAKNLIHIDPLTGIYRGNSSVIANGNISLDTTKARQLDGSIKFYNARVAWAEPFLTGIMSNLTGSVNGSVEVMGTQGKPIIDGKVSVTNAGLRLDFMGCNYTIPQATVAINNQRINLGQIEVFDSYHNPAILSGHFSHDLFEKMRMRLKVTTKKFEVMNLARGENEYFYGKMMASMDSFTIRGAFDNIRLNLYNGEPAAKSTLFIPASSGGYVGAYSYVTFKTYGTDQEKTVRKRKDRISINLDANLNKLAEIHVVLDPNTEDEIVATGDGNIQIDLPPNNDMRMSGLYTIDKGTYTLTFQQVAIHRVFRLNPGSTISFNGPFAETNLAVDAVYSVKARLYDLLSSSDKAYIRGPELIDAQTPQMVNVTLHMKGPIYRSLLTFDLDLENKHSQGTTAHSNLLRINSDDRQKFDQVASLLLVGSFIPPEGLGNTAAISGAINNVSQILSSTASQGLTSIVNKILGDRNLNVAVKYTNYNYSDQQAFGNVNRNQLKLGLTKNYLNDRLMVSVGSTSDWGKPAAAGAASTFNVAGDFRFQYQLSQTSNLRFNVFHTSDYDLTIDRNIQRSGFGISWRKSFDNLGEFFRGNKYARLQKEKKLKQLEAGLDSAATKKED